MIGCGIKHNQKQNMLKWYPDRQKLDVYLFKLLNCTIVKRY